MPDTGLAPGDTTGLTSGRTGGLARRWSWNDNASQQAIEAHWAAFESAIQAEDLDEATNILTQVRALNPEEPGLAAGEQRLEAAQAALERKRQAAEAKARQYAGDMVSIPGGTFRMGDLKWRWVMMSERPVHSVTVPDFKLGKHEVTVGQFRRLRRGDRVPH